MIITKAIAGFALGLLIACSAQAGTSPNFIVILADDLGWSSLSVPMDKSRPKASSDFYRTPNMDSIIEGGLRFSQGYAASPVCSPSRYSIQFGKTPARLKRTRGMGTNRADHNQLAIPQVLKRIDPAYRAAHIGKWHIDEDPARYEYDLHDGQTKNKEGAFDTNEKQQWRGYAEKDPKRVYSLTERAVQFMRESSDQGRPFFLQISHYAVHSNIVYSESSFDSVSKRRKGKLHRNRAYAAMLEDLDRSIGVLLDAYRDMGLAENTYIIFTSDNGGMPVIPTRVGLGKPYKRGLNAPLLRGKWDLTEGGIRVPFAIFGPGIEPGSQSDVPVVSYDLMPTLADLAGGLQHLPENIDGGSLRPLFSSVDYDVARPSNALFFHYPHYNKVGMFEPHSAIRVGRYKLIDYPVSGRSLLFDLDSRAGELNDISAAQPELAVLMREKLHAYLVEVDAERPEQADNWESVGKRGAARSRFFDRYEGKL